MSIFDLLKKLELNPYQTWRENEGGLGIVNCMNGYSVSLVRDPEYASSLLECDVLLCDGVLPKLLCYFYRVFGVVRVTGPDFCDFVLESGLLDNQVILLIGATDETLNKLKTHFQAKLQNATIKVFAPDFVEEITEDFVNAIQTQIDMSEPDFIFIGLSAPKQEKLVGRLNLPMKLKSSFQVGAAFDFLSHNSQRAPALFIWLGLEWFWRLLLQPKKISYRLFSIFREIFRF